MGLNDPLPRLLRLRGSLVRSLPTGEISPSAAKGLTETYARLLDSARDVVSLLDVDVEFSRQFASMAGATISRNDLIGNHEVALRAATFLRQIAGYVEGLIEAVVLDQKVTTDQMEAARAAARQSPGFT